MRTNVQWYNWKHLPTGTTGKSRFTKYHAAEANASAYFDQFGSALEFSVALELLNKWAGTSDVWKYWL